MKLSPQSNKVLTHLRAESHITSWQAEGVYRIRRLASRIDEIVAAGYGITKDEAKDATGQRYIRYSLSAPQKLYHGPINPARERVVRQDTYTLSQVEEALVSCTNNDVIYRSDIARVLKTLKESV